VVQSTPVDVGQMPTSLGLALGVVIAVDVAMVFLVVYSDRMWVMCVDRDENGENC
jgi:hypothetical protein